MAGSGLPPKQTRLPAPPGLLVRSPPPPAEAQTGEKHPGSCREEKVSGVGSSAPRGCRETLSGGCRGVGSTGHL